MKQGSHLRCEVCNSKKEVQEVKLWGRKRLLCRACLVIAQNIQQNVVNETIRKRNIEYIGE